MKRFVENLVGNKKTEKIEVTDIRRLISEKIPKSLESTRTKNSEYGVAYQLKRFAGIDTSIPLNCTIEHGICVRESVYQLEVMHHVSHILTISSFREKVIADLTDIIPVAIGPYIAYVEDCYTEDYMKETKKRNGRVLLVMPSHSTVSVSISYNVQQFIQQIEKAKKGFDTVMICMHWADIRKGLEKPYREKGYHIVSAGNTKSPHFLSRLKYILYLCDAVIMNTFTTGMAYALYMDKPVRLIKQSIKYTVPYYQHFLDFEDGNYSIKLYELFDNNTFFITKEQKEFCNYIFGFEKVKTKKQMRQLLLPLLRTVGENVI